MPPSRRAPSLATPWIARGSRPALKRSCPPRAATAPVRGRSVRLGASPLLSFCLSPPSLVHGQAKSNSDRRASSRRRGVVAPLPRSLRAASARTLPLPPALGPQSVGRRRSRSGRALPCVREAGGYARAARESARVALPDRVEPVDRPRPRPEAGARTGSGARIRQGAARGPRSGGDAPLPALAARARRGGGPRGGPPPPGREPPGPPPHARPPPISPASPARAAHARARPRG